MKVLIGTALLAILSPGLFELRDARANVGDLPPTVEAGTILGADGVRIVKPGGTVFGECWECLACAFFTMHKNPIMGTADKGYLAPHGECISPSYCEGGHPSCSGFAMGTEEAITKVLASDGRELLEVLQRHSSYLILNMERQAVQVIGCSGHLEAHIPLSEKQFLELSSQLAVED
jgi:hypothetical protein